LKREELEELHYISPIVNVPSILTHGILSHNKAKEMEHESCASQDIQDRRARVIVPGGGPLHDYVNLYFNARNPMMYSIKESHNTLTVLSISPDIIDLPGIIVTDRNASRDFTLFKPASDGLDIIDPELIFAEHWTHPNDPIKYDEHQGIMCAEVLVPTKADAHYILKAYVSCNQSYEATVNILSTARVNLEVVINGHLFFQ